MAGGQLNAPPTSSAVRFRRPSEADHRTIVNVVDEWFGGRHIRATLPRLWFRHFAGTSWVAEDAARIVGFLVGFVSPDRPDEAVILTMAVDPNRRRRGVGAGLVERFASDVVARGARRLSAIVPPDDRVALDFLRGLGFVAVEGPGTVRLYGTPAFADYEADREDRAVLVREG